MPRVLENNGYVYRSHGVYQWLAVVGLVLYGLLDIARAFVGIVAMQGAGVFNGSAPDSEIKDVAKLLYVITAGPQMLIVIPLIVFFCIWVHRSATNARALGASGFEISPGWAVGWYFIPVACLLMPYRALSEIIRSSRSDSPFDVSTGWWSLRAGFILPLWWATWIIGQILVRVSTSFWLDRAGIGSESIAAILMPFAHMVRLLAAVLCIVLIIRLTNSQRLRAIHAQRFQSDPTAE